MVDGQPIVAGHPPVPMHGVITVQGSVLPGVGHGPVKIFGDASRDS